MQARETKHARSTVSARRTCAIAHLYVAFSLIPLTPDEDIATF
jgi:hypothetical protein